jgi:hypothetical protein
MGHPGKMSGAEAHLARAGFVRGLKPPPRPEQPTPRHTIKLG